MYSRQSRCSTGMLQLVLAWILMHGTETETKCLCADIHRLSRQDAESMAYGKRPGQHQILAQYQPQDWVTAGITQPDNPVCFVYFDLQCIQTIDAGGEVDSMLLSGKMLIVGLHISAEEGMVRAWHIDTGSDVVLPGRHRVRPAPCETPPHE